ncbi:hypothetical protein JOM56_007948 [Amanita muscaria]
MLFSRIALFALPAIAAAAVLPRDNQCKQDTSQMCCNNLVKESALSEGQKKLVTASGFQLDNAAAQFGFACTPIANAPLASSVAGCQTYNVCCQNTTATGVVAMNCSPIIL